MQCQQATDDAHEANIYHAKFERKCKLPSKMKRTKRNTEHCQCPKISINVVQMTVMSSSNKSFQFLFFHFAFSNFNSITYGIHKKMVESKAKRVNRKRKSSITNVQKRQVIYEMLKRKQDNSFLLCAKQ